MTGECKVCGEAGKLRYGRCSKHRSPSCSACGKRQASVGSSRCERCYGAAAATGPGGKRTLGGVAAGLSARLDAAARRLGMTPAALTAEVLEVWLLNHEKGFSEKAGKYD